MGQVSNRVGARDGLHPTPGYGTVVKIGCHYSSDPPGPFVENRGRITLEGEATTPGCPHQQVKVTLKRPIQKSVAGGTRSASGWTENGNIQGPMDESRIPM